MTKVRSDAGSVYFLQSTAGRPIIRCSVRQAYGWVAEGKIPSHVYGGERRVRKVDVHEYIAGMPTVPARASGRAN